MKQKGGPIALMVAVVAGLACLVFMYRACNPPQPPNDTDNPKGISAYARNFRAAQGGRAARRGNDRLYGRA